MPCYMSLLALLLASVGLAAHPPNPLKTALEQDVLDVLDIKSHLSSLITNGAESVITFAVSGQVTLVPYLCQIDDWRARNLIEFLFNHDVLKTDLARDITQPLYKAAEAQAASTVEYLLTMPAPNDQVIAKAFEICSRSQRPWDNKAFKLLLNRLAPIKESVCDRDVQEGTSVEVHVQDTLNRAFVKAAQKGDLARMQLLEQHGADIGAVDHPTTRNNAAHMVVWKNNSQPIWFWLFQHKRELFNQANAQGKTPLELYGAPEQQDESRTQSSLLSIVRNLFLTRSTDAVEVCRSFGTFLCHLMVGDGARHPNLEAMKANLSGVGMGAASIQNLVDSYPPVAFEPLDDTGKTALMFLASIQTRNVVAVARQLCRHGASINHVAATGATALSLAIESGNKELVRFLLNPILNTKTDTNPCEKIAVFDVVEGLFACIRRAPDYDMFDIIFSYMVNNEFSVYLKSASTCLSPFLLAASKADATLMKKMCGARKFIAPNQVDEFGNTAAHLAATSDADPTSAIAFLEQDPELFRLLDVTNGDGKTARQLLAERPAAAQPRSMISAIHSLTAAFHRFNMS